MKRIPLQKKLLTLVALLSFATARPMDIAQQWIAHAWNNVEEHPIASVTLPAAAIAGVYINNAVKQYNNAISWNWPSINTHRVNNQPIGAFFKQHAQQLAAHNETWLWGSGTSAHQVEGGCTNNNWYEFAHSPEQKNTIVDAGIACDHWNKYPEDIALMANFGLNAYRFSVEWSKIVPQEGVIDYAALDHYEDVCKRLVAAGIKPVITLYHYTDPIWFTRLGGWEKAENCKHFIFFAQTVFERLHKYVHLWLTFNAPESYALTGWTQGLKPPAKKDQWELMAQVMHNLFETHVNVYRALKSMPGGNTSRIGVLKNIYQLDPWRLYHPGDHIMCYFGNKLVNDSFYTYLTTGQLSIYTPTKVNKTFAPNEYLKNGGACLDFIGLNYYCHGYMKGKTILRDEKNEIPANNERYTIYGEGLYRAIEEISSRVAQPLNIPIYVTENGIGTDNEQHRTLFLERYLYALAKAIDKGHDVRGYFYWSLLDNYEWGTYSKRYGLFKVDFADPNLTRTKKAGAQYYEDIIHATFA
ncbi:beta-glucosidase [Candidatus Dependentiae bacterium Noda2021]|nr:beta-glucosidase [Candidatus Dependentiae bacterium Noda2021]